MSRRNKRKFNQKDINTKIEKEYENQSSIEVDKQLNTSNGNNILRIKRKCKPGNTNTYGIIYTVNSYNEVLKNDIIPLINKRLLSSEVFFGNNNPYDDFDDKRFYLIDARNSICNRIVNVSDEYVDVEFSNIDLFNIIKENIDNAFMEMRYIGKIDDANNYTVPKVYNIIKIVAFDIVVKGKFPYNNYIEFEKYYER